MDQRSCRCTIARRLPRRLPTLLLKRPEMRDANFRVATAADGIHVYSGRLHATGREAMAFFPSLDVAHDGAHAFYLGTELMKAEIALRAWQTLRAGRTARLGLRRATHGARRHSTG